MKRLLTAAVLCAVLILVSVWSVKAVDNTRSPSTWRTTA